MSSTSGGGGGRPPLIGRPAGIQSLGRPAGTVAGLAGGRQSPLLLNRVPYSPVNRRMRKPSLPSSLLRKSFSLDNMAGDSPVPDSKPASTKEIVEPDLIEETVDGVESEVRPTAEKDLGVPVILTPPDDDGEDQPRFHEVATNVEDRLTSYSSLPRPISRSKSITRSLVPRMRRMFEKSRSCDPELGDTASNRVPEPTRLYFNSDTANGEIHRDGTESTTSSFILLDTGLRRGGSSLTLSSQGGDLRSAEVQDRKPRSGFVNKCVTKVKSFIGNKSEERE